MEIQELKEKMNFVDKLIKAFKSQAPFRKNVLDQACPYQECHKCLLRIHEAPPKCEIAEASKGIFSTNMGFLGKATYYKIKVLKQLERKIKFKLIREIKKL